MRMPSDKAANAPVFEVDPNFGEMAVAMGQATWSILELSQREKALACIAADICVRDLGLPFEMHVRMALANDVPLSHVREAILQSAIEAGHTGALVALTRFKEVCGEIGESVPPNGSGPDGNHSFDYFAEAERIDGDLLQQWRAIMPAHWSQPGLDVKERIYISLTGNVLEGVLGAPFAHHVRLARAHGATDAQIRALFRFLSEYGFSRSWAAIDALAALVAHT
jgi:alkylhydroperoxidase/carboxymuconolactone decarboxylase family protein YurZ